MSAPRRNEVAVIANLVPRAIGYLTIPLTPSRAAALAAFTARTGIEAQALAIDLIDDVIFDLCDAPPAPSRGPSTSRE